MKTKEQFIYYNVDVYNMTDEYLINMWVEFKTDSVERRLQIAEELRRFLATPKRSDMKVSGDDGLELSYTDDDYMHPDDVSDFMHELKNSGDVLAYEYNVDEIVYTNIHHLYIGD